MKLPFGSCDEDFLHNDKKKHMKILHTDRKMKYEHALTLTALTQKEHKGGKNAYLTMVFFFFRKKQKNLA